MNSENNRYTWVETYKKIVQYLVGKKNEQFQLIQILKDIGVTEFNDKDENGNTIELEEIDPFTFFCYLNKYGSNRRIEILKALSLKLKFELVPLDDSGIPSANAQKVWMFPYKYERKSNEIKRLWNFFQKTLDNTITDADFDDILIIKSTGKTKLTEALFNINPEKYFPINGPTKPFLKEILGIDPTFKSYSDYMLILDKLKKLQKPFYKISYEAWEWNINNNKTNYWIFQGNPKNFDIETALNSNILDNWKVSAHKDKIAPGDKVIIWITGDKSGCYALAEVTTLPQIFESSKDSHLWISDDNNHLKVGISITHNFISNPLYSDEIKQIPALANLKVGNQGTNFSSDIDEYNAIVEYMENRNNIQYWVYAPGENAVYWDEFYSLGIMALGWEKLGSFNQYKTKEDIVKKLQELESTDGSKKNDSTACWEFTHNIHLGDIIFLKKGRSQYLGYGIVQSDYFYDDKRSYFKNCRKVKWIKKGEWEADHNIVLKTLTDITPYPDYVKKLKDIFQIDNSSNNVNGANKMSLPLNTILYGPPGTGKTYKLIQLFSEFTEHKASQTKEEWLVKEITTIPWWQVVAAALYRNSDVKVPQLMQHDFIRAKISVTNQASPNAMLWAMLQQHTKADCKNVNYSKRIEPGLFSKNEDSIWSIDKEALENEIPEIIDFLNKYDNYKEESSLEIKNFEFISFHQSYSYEDFIEGIKPVIDENDADSRLRYEIKEGVFKSLARRATANKDKKFALFIDEINRGNISSIFGELISLIEDDKRCDIPVTGLMAELPYSRKPFGIPSNLYIIGTMNTADRSVEALDTALRRRFSFIEMMPKPELLDKIIHNEITINLPLLLETINKRLRFLLDRDHQIGHSYFINVETVSLLKLIFADKIIPLLKEYFFNDYEKIMMVLSKDFVKDISDDNPFKGSEYFDNEHKTYEIVDVHTLKDDQFAEFIVHL